MKIKFKCLYTKEQMLRICGKVPSKNSEITMTYTDSDDIGIIKWSDKKSGYGKRLYEYTIFTKES